MTLRARIQRGFLWRYRIMALAGFLFGAWFAFDGLVTYPKRVQHAEAFEKIQAETKGEAEQVRRWRELASSQNWPAEVPEKSAKTIRYDILGQYVLGTLCLLLSIPPTYLYFRSRHRWVESTADGLITSWGQRMRFADVTLLDKKRWDAKGLARASYTEAGKKKVFVFDDFKYDREPLDQILRLLEAELRPEQIVGGISEAEHDRREQAAQGDESSAPASDPPTSDQA